MIDFEKELNDAQLDVVKNGDGPCLVLAGAGSGKTRTITYRVAYLLEQGVDPKQILLVTFTNKAAREMMERVQVLMGGELRLPWSGTFHHIAYRILHRYATVLGYEHNFSILDSEDSRDMLKFCIAEEGIDRKQRRFPSPKVIQAIISYTRNAQRTIADVLEVEHPQWVQLEDVLTRIAEEYRKRKQRVNVMDFDDLLVNLYILLLQHTRVREVFATQFKYVLVDEYQDTNKIQAAIVKQFASIHKNLLVVGDDAQSIYSFRAADIQNILDFSAPSHLAGRQGGSVFGGENGYPDAKVFKLEINYRSTPNILDVANDVISYNKKQFTKELKSSREAFTKPEVHAFPDNSSEASFIAQRIIELRDEGVALKHIAVLFRAAYHAQALEMELTKCDIPYDFRGGIRFFERAHVKDMLAYLRILNNKSDQIAWSRILNMQIGIGPASVNKVYQFIANSSEPIGELVSKSGALLSARGQVGWSDFLQIFELMQNVDVNNPHDLIKAITSSRYQEYLENEYPDFKERLLDLDQLALFASKYDNLEIFLAEATLQEGFAKEQATTSEKKEEGMILSTIHQAKGLEWEVVFVMNLAQGQFPIERSIKSDELEEERRLFYVAVTRAKKYLYLSYPLISNSYSTLQGASTFINEINSDLIHKEGMGNMIGSSFFDPSDDEDDISYEALDDDQPVRSFLKSIEEL